MTRNDCICKSHSPGYSATDTEDGNLTSSVTITGTVSSFKSGTYHLIYNVTDGSGAPAAGIVRTIVVHPTFSSLQNLNYAYDQNGNITEIIDGSTVSTARGVNYTYDDLNRLTGATIHTASTTETLTYSYSSIGNISSSTESGAYTYANTNYANPHAATEIGTASMLYDNNGNLTSDGTLAYLWDYRNRLTLSGNGTASSTNVFDSGMNRVKLTENGVSTYFPNKYFNKIGTTGTTTKHLFIGDFLAATIEQIGTSTPITHYIHTDHLGGTNAITNQNGLIQILDYYPYGTTRIDEKTGSYSERRQFAGTERETNGLNYMMNRFESSNQGRFVSEDPVHLAIGSSILEQLTGKNTQSVLADPQSLNSYSYARNNPIVNKDPNGLYLESGFDMAMLGLSLHQFYKEPSWINAGGVALDAGSLMLPGVPAIGGMALRSGRVADKALDTEKTYQIYAKTKQGANGADELYIGRTSGRGSPEANVKARDSRHHMTNKGFGASQVLLTTKSPNAIRGLEQIGMDYGRSIGQMANQIRGISLSNPNLGSYLQAAQRQVTELRSAINKLMGK